MNMLIQDGTGRIYPHTPFLEKRHDMKPYRGEAFEGKEPVDPVQDEPESPESPEAPVVPMTEKERILAMTKEELVAYAKEQGIDFDMRKNKRAIMFHILKTKGLEE